MPMYNLACPQCKELIVDVYEPIEAPKRQCIHCFCDLERVIGCRTAIGDEIDVEVKHGLCNPDGSPRRFRSRQEMERVAKERGLTNFVQHVPKPGSDKSPHTTSWASGPPPGVDMRPTCMLTPEEQAKRHDEWLKS